MKFFLNARIWALAAFGLLAAGTRTDAQFISLSVAASTNQIVVSNSVTYTINLTNATTITLTNVFVTNTLSSTPGMTVAWSANASQGSIFTNADGDIVFDLTNLIYGASAQMTLTQQPMAVGFMTNNFFADGEPGGFTASTNLVTQVITTEADLGVALLDFPSPIMVNDQVIYSVAVTNFGPNTAPNFTVTNSLPTGVILKNVSATNYTVSGSNLIFNFGALAAGANTNLQFTIQPTNAGALTFSASVGSAGLLDTNTANNSAGTNITVQNFSGTLIATNVSAMTYNPQNGLMEQTIALANVGTNAVAAARVIVSGLTNWLYNAIGTNNGNPFVAYNDTLNTNQSVNLVLEYFVPTRLPVTISNSQYTAVGVPMANLSAPTGTNGVFYITKMTMTNGYVVVEFQSTPGLNYTVLYSDNVTFSNALAAQPSITAQANRTQWIDNGPPNTVSPPTSGQRFYRVMLNQ